MMSSKAQAASVCLALLGISDMLSLGGLSQILFPQITGVAAVCGLCGLVLLLISMGTALAKIWQS